MKLSDFITTMRPPIENELQRMISQNIMDDTPELKEMMDYHLGWVGEGSGSNAQGKRIRSMLVLLTTGAIAGKWEQALPAAASVELLHNFSLIHDDIQDNSPIRRGRPTVWKKWGMAQAINAGDLLFTLAELAMLTIGNNLTKEICLESVILLNNACTSLTHGQYLDMAYETRDTMDLDSYLKMIQGKTASLLGCCTELGAVIAGSNPIDRELWKKFGFSLGIAFQVVDDYLGIWGDSAIVGKSIDSDLVSGKKTLPILFGLSRNGKFIKLWEKAKIQPEDVPNAAHLLEKEGARKFTEEYAEKNTREALKYLDKAAHKSDFKDALIELTHLLLSRNK